MNNKNTFISLKRILQSDLFISCILLVVIISAYKSLFHTYFQQDEWYSLGSVYSEGLNAVLSRYSVLELLSGKIRFFGTLFNNAFHFFFPLQIYPFVITSIILHWFNSILLYLTVKIISKNSIISMITALVFSVAFVPHQALTWFAANTTTLPNALFLLLSLYLYIYHLNTKKIIFRNLSLFSLIVSYYFKESSIFMFVLLPFTSYILAKKEFTLKTIIKDHYVLFIFLFVILILRILDFGGPDGKIGAFITNNSSTSGLFMLNMLLYPLIGFGQTIIPPILILKAAAKFQNIMYGFLSTTTMQSSILENITSDILSLFIALTGIFLFILLLNLFKNNRKLYLYFIVFTFVSFLPYVMITRGSSFIDSRYFYLPSLGASVLVGIYLYELLQWALGFNKPLRFSFISVFIFIFSVFLYKNIIYIQRSLNADVLAASERVQILKSISQHANFSDRTVLIYITGDHEYFGVKGQYLPFQQNIGYTLAVMNKNSIPNYREILKNIFLFQMGKEWISTNSNSTYGYYWNLDTLSDTIHKYNIQPSSVYGFYYKSADHELFNISNSLRSSLSN